ncbi:hypothetical protein RRG08_057505, partial [Elysia crispata]
CGKVYTFLATIFTDHPYVAYSSAAADLMLDISRASV